MFNDRIEMKLCADLILDLAAEAKECVTKEDGKHWLNFDEIQIGNGGKSTIEVAFVFRGKRVSKLQFSGGYIDPITTCCITGIEGRSSICMSKP